MRISQCQEDKESQIYLNLGVSAFWKVDTAQLDGLSLRQAEVVHDPLRDTNLSGIGGKLEHTAEEAAFMISGYLEDYRIFLLSGRVAAMREHVRGHVASMI